MYILSRLNPEPSPEVLAERPERLRERLRFRAMVREVLHAAP